MFKNYVKIAWRNILKRKMTSVISVSSLAIGLAVCFIIGLFVLHELSYDRFIPGSDRIVRIILDVEDGYRATTPPGLAHALETTLPGVETVTEISWPREYLVNKGNEPFMVKNILRADSNFFDVFPLKMREGNAKEALAQPGKVILTESTAHRLFGKKRAMGQIIAVELYPGNILNFEVGGIVEEPPSNLHFNFNALLSLTIPGQRRLRYGDEIQWHFAGGYIYAKLNENISIASFQERITHLEQQMAKPDWIDAPMLTVQPLTDIHLATNVYSEIAPQGDRRYLLIFSAIGLLILGVACFNYMNLSTARTLPRAGEVGLRKVVGATRKNLIIQFMTEAVVTSLLAFPVALLITEATLSFVYEFLGERFAYGLFDYPQLLMISLGIVLLSGIISGMYPALAISLYGPAAIFRKWRASGSHGSVLQKGLVVVQFAIAVLLLTSTVVIYKQLEYIRNKKLGFNKEQVVLFNASALQDQYHIFKEDLLNNTPMVSMTSGPPLGLGWKNMITLAEDSSGKRRDLSVLNVDYDYVKTMGLQLKSGRIFSEAYSLEEETSVIINESAAEWFDLGEEVVGQIIEISGHPREVIGLVEDFHNEPLKEKIQPVALILNPGNNWTTLVRLAPGNIQQGISDIRQVWDEFLPGRPLNFSFLDERIAAQYRAEQQQSTLMSVFAGIAILIACIGLLGLTTLLTLNRTKEIGIRKVLGATVSHIVGLLSKDFLKLVLLGFVIAIPVAWYAMNRWLQDFAYRIEIGPGIFALAGGAALLIALLTVSWQSVRAALANPVESLRSE